MLMRRGILDVQVRIIRYVDRHSCLEVPAWRTTSAGPHLLSAQVLMLSRNISKLTTKIGEGRIYEYMVVSAATFFAQRKFPNVPLPC